MSQKRTHVIACTDAWLKDAGQPTYTELLQKVESMNHTAAQPLDLDRLQVLADILYKRDSFAISAELNEMIAQARAAKADTMASGSIGDDNEFQCLVGDVYSAGSHNESIEKSTNALVAYIDSRATLAPVAAPVQIDEGVMLHLSRELIAALKRLSLAAQTTGGTAGPDAELQAAIGQAEQALSLGAVARAMNAAEVAPVDAQQAAAVAAPAWIVKHYTGTEWPIIKGNGIELECAGATREQANAIAAKLAATPLVAATTSEDARDAALEEAAQMCERQEFAGGDTRAKSVCKGCAAAIRSLRATQQEGGKCGS